MRLQSDHLLSAQLNSNLESLSLLTRTILRRGLRGSNREVRFWKSAATATIVLVALIAFNPTPRTQEARAADSSAKDLVLRSLKIVDEQGNKRIRLDIVQNRPTLTLFDEKGTPRTGLSASDAGGMLALYDEEGTMRAGLAAFRAGPPERA